jgi:hypothetical protein
MICLRYLDSRLRGNDGYKDMAIPQESPKKQINFLTTSALSGLGDLAVR